MEASRKHGSFDMRWPCVRSDSSIAAPMTAVPEVAEDEEELDWGAFDARFPTRRRHDLERLSAYATYKLGRESESNGHPKTPGLRLVLSDPVAPVIEAEADAAAQRLVAAVAAVQVWEGAPAAADRARNGLAAAWR